MLPTEDELTQYYGWKKTLMSSPARVSDGLTAPTTCQSPGSVRGGRQRDVQLHLAVSVPDAGEPVCPRVAGAVHQLRDGLRAALRRRELATAAGWIRTTSHAQLAAAVAQP